jgi:signal transduction histidine kinase
MRSLKRRLIGIVSLSVAAAFLFTALLCWRVVTAAVERDFDARLSGAMSDLLSAADRGQDGILSLARTPGDPVFNRPHSGWYWSISDGATVLARSRSLPLGDAQAPPVADVAPDEPSGPVSRPARGADGQSIRYQQRILALRDGRGDLAILVAGPESLVRDEVWLSMRWLLAGLAVIAIVLIGLVALEIDQGLRPLKRLAHDIERAWQGDIIRIGEPGYRELAPLARGINDLVEQVGSVVDRARAQAGNLAHAIKTPLSLISARNESRGTGQDEDVRLSVAAIRRQIDHHLKRTRFAGKARLASEPVPVRAAIDDIVLVMTRSYQDRGLAFAVSVAGDAIFPGEREDLEEMLGNIIENACKWAKKNIDISVRSAGERLIVQVDDDGPGLPVDQRARALERGRRLDDTIAGSGLGLAIVADLVALYDGGLDLLTSEVGGLRVVLSLPSSRRSG